MLTFTPLTNFFSEETRSQYCQGMNYSVLDSDSALNILVPKWVEQGLVRLGEANIMAGRMEGKE